MIGRAGVDNSRGKSDTYKDYSSWAVPDVALDDSRNESEDRNATPDYNWSSDIPRPE